MCYICKRKGDIVLEEGTVCEACFHWLTETKPTEEQIQMRQEYYYYERRRK